MVKSLINCCALRSAWCIENKNSDDKISLCALRSPLLIERLKARGNIKRCLRYNKNNLNSFSNLGTLGLSSRRIGFNLSFSKAFFNSWRGVEMRVLNNSFSILKDSDISSFNLNLKRLLNG